jgi:dihydrofolate reductase
MPTFLAIAAISENRAIGYQGNIPWHLPDDFRWFKHKTMGGTLIMGRKTFASIGHALPGRKTVVLSRGADAPLPEGVTVCDTASLEKKLIDLPGPYWICGGADVYRQMLRHCSALYLTRVRQVVPGDAFFPPFEDKFELEQTIHHGDDFIVERWRRLFHADPPLLEPEEWPFEKK